ncbi:hypothetical protein LSAT2_019477, partial [Lamellibrachia satsuma]
IETDAVNEMHCQQNTDLDDGGRPTPSQRRCAVKRTVFTRHQLLRMEERFSCQTFLSKEERRQFAGELCLGERQVMIWFQNRRGRLKRRGPSDKAYTPSKLEELTNRRPYPFIVSQLITRPTSPATLPQGPAAWAMYRQRVSVNANCPAVPPCKDAVHPNVNMFPDMTSVTMIDSNTSVRQWMPCMTADTQQQIRQTYNIKPYYNAGSWSCNAFRPNTAVRENPVSGRSHSELSRTTAAAQQLPVCSSMTATPGASAESCNGARQQATDMTYFSSEPAQSGYRQDYFGVNMNECVHVW